MKQLRFPRDFLLSFVTILLFCLVVDFASAQATKDGDDLVWFIQLADLHISKYHPERAADLKNKVAAALSLIQPSLVLITGDLTGKRGH
jgi:predicted MPP superfamily phosphohydrolase